MPVPTTKLNARCQYFGKCSGCKQWHSSESLTAQKQFTELSQIHWPTIRLPKIQHHPVGPFHFRQKLDFTLADGKFGLYETGTKNLLTIESCAIATLELNTLLKEFHTRLPLISKGSVRLRVSPKGDYGVWLDFSNLDIKALLDDGTFFDSLSQLAHVEIGQKHKQLIKKNGKFKLSTPVLKEWTETYSNNNSYGLSSYLSSFTQTGAMANKIFARLTEQTVSQIGPRSILEFGCGIGTLTIPAYLASPNLTNYLACEIEEDSLAGLRQTQKKIPALAAGKLQLVAGDFQKATSLNISTELILVNPPRSGIGRFFDNISSTTKNIIYVSCFTESLIEDCKILISMGYILKEVHLIDQFPWTSHAEWFAVWVRN